MRNETAVKAVIDWLATHGEQVTIVGGQALAIWEQILLLPTTVQTFDIDLLGSGEQAEALAELIGGEARFAGIDDHSPNTAIVTLEGEVLVDFLAYVNGVSENDILLRRLEIEPSGGGVLFLMHPVDCLEGKLANYVRLPEKRNQKGLDQLQSAMTVCCEYIRTLIGTDKESLAIKLSNRVFSLASKEEGKRVYVLNKIDLLEAIPPDIEFSTTAYHRENGPRKRIEIIERRRKYTEYLRSRGLLVNKH